MANKKIVVDSCEHCPLHELRGGHYYCTHAATDGMLLFDLYDVPKQCPLEGD